MNDDDWRKNGEAITMKNNADTGGIKITLASVWSRANGEWNHIKVSLECSSVVGVSGKKNTKSNEKYKTRGEVNGIRKITWWQKRKMYCYKRSISNISLMGFGEWKAEEERERARKIEHTKQLGTRFERRNCWKHFQCFLSILSISFYQLHDQCPSTQRTNKMYNVQRGLYHCARQTFQCDSNNSNRVIYLIGFRYRYRFVSVSRGVFVKVCLLWGKGVRHHKSINHCAGHISDWIDEIS